MLYAKLKNGQIETFPIREEDLRKLLPNISFTSREITSEDLAGTEYIAIPHNKNATIPVPTADAYTSVGMPVQNADGVWERTYQSYTITDEVFKQDRINQKFDELRAKRTELLIEADAMQQKAERDIRAGRTPSCTIEQIDAYKDALCDITNAADPFLVEFPAKP